MAQAAKDAVSEALEAALKFADATLRGRQDHWDAMRGNAEALATGCGVFFDEAADHVATDAARDASCQLLVDRAVRLLQRLREIREPRNAEAVERFRGSRAFYRGACALLLTLNHSPDNPSDSIMALASFAQSGVDVMKHTEASAFALLLFRRLRDTLQATNLALLEQRVGPNEKTEVLANVTTALEHYADAVQQGDMTLAAAAEIEEAVKLLGRLAAASSRDLLRVARIAHYHGRRICGDPDARSPEVIDKAIACLRIAMDACERCEAPAEAGETRELQGKLLFALCYCFAERSQPERAIICLTNLEKMNGSSADAAASGAPQDAVPPVDIQLARCFIFTRNNDLESAMAAIQQLIRDHNHYEYALDAIRKFGAATGFDHRASILLEELLQKFSFEPKTTEIKVELALNLLAKSKSLADTTSFADEAAKIFDDIAKAGSADAAARPPTLLRQVRRALWLWTSHLRSLDLAPLVNEWCTRILGCVPPASLTDGGTEQAARADELARTHLWKSAALLDLAQTEAALTHAEQAFRAKADEASLVGVFAAAAHTPQAVPELIAATVERMAACQLDAAADRRALLMTLVRCSNGMKINPTRRCDLLFQLLNRWLEEFMDDTRQRRALPSSPESFGLVVRSMIKAAIMKVDAGHHGELLYLKGSSATLDFTLSAAARVSAFLEALPPLLRERPNSPTESAHPPPGSRPTAPVLASVGSEGDFEYVATVLWNVAYTAAQELELPAQAGSEVPAAPAESEGGMSRKRGTQRAFVCAADFHRVVLQASNFQLEGYVAKDATPEASMRENPSDGDAMDVAPAGEGNGAQEAGDRARGPDPTLFQLELIKRQAQALAAAVTLELEFPPTSGAGTTATERLSELERLSAVLIDQAQTADDPVTLRIRDLCVALHLDASTTQDTLDAFLRDRERLLFSMAPMVLLRMTDRLAGRHTLPLAHLYRLYRLCHQLVVRRSGTRDRHVLLRIFTSMFRFSATNDASLGILDEALQVGDLAAAEAFLSRALQLLRFTGEPFQEENHQDVSALYAQALEQKGRRGAALGDGVDSFFR